VTYRDRLRSDHIRAQLHRSGIHTLIEAVALVVLVVVCFCRAGAPASFRSCRAGGYRRYAGGIVAGGVFDHSLTLFGLVLATGIVVDDAIVVVENIERKIEDGLNPHAAAHAAMGEVTRPIISICLVLCAGSCGCLRLRSDRAILPPVRHNDCGEHAHIDLHSLTLSPALAACC